MDYAESADVEQLIRFLAQGGFEISAEMRRGKVVWVRIKARESGTMRLLNPWKGKLPELPAGARICQEDNDE